MTAPFDPFQSAPASILDEALAPYASLFIDPVVRDLAVQTLPWVRAHIAAVGEDRVPRLVVVACAYARLCAPIHATRRQLHVAARFTLVFFLVDDAPDADLESLLADPQAWNIGQLTNALRAWLEDFPELDRCAVALRARFARAYHDYLAARRAEPELRASVLSVDDHWRIRRRTIFMDPYVDQWIISMGIDPDAAGEGSFAEARRIGTDIVLLSNDLGSIHRDRAGGEAHGDLNLVDSYQRERGWSRDEAVAKLIMFHNQMVESYRAHLAAALAANPGEHGSSLAELLTAVVDGNLASLHALRFRYQTVDDVLSQLSPVRPAELPITLLKAWNTGRDR